MLLMISITPRGEDRGDSTVDRRCLDNALIFSLFLRLIFFFVILRRMFFNERDACIFFVYI